MSGVKTLTPCLCAILVAAAWLAIPNHASAAAPDKPVTQTTFDSAQAAVDALLAALRNDDSAALLNVFGQDASGLVSSGDAVADSNTRARFVASYDTAHELVAADDGSYVLEVGDDAWPAPTPIIQTDGKWYFDTAAGIDEVVYRRIGNNELGAIESCLGIVAAQQEYAAEGHDGRPAGIYAQKLMSDPGKRNGLYWKPAEGERASPVGRFIALAAAQGYKQSKGPSPYHGYIYNLLTAQGPAAEGGAKPYLVNGVLTDGFAAIAYPVEYEASGVASFIVNQDGVVYQKDLGSGTTEIAAAIDVFNPDDTWTQLD